MTTALPEITLRADSITVTPTFMGVQHITVFNPDAETKKLLKNLHHGKITYHRMTLVDKFDDGTEDTHFSSRPFDIVDVSIGCERKLHTWILTIKQYWSRY